jgi:hypothetical protein
MEAIRRAVGAMRSALQSGESWSSELQRDYDKAIKQIEDCETDAKLKGERDEEVREVLNILGAGEKESLKDAATRRMWQAMPDLMRERESPRPADAPQPERVL